ncbi:ATP-binding protein [Terriglobus sp.]|uniref:ATP-binding protein n=1 Tax=Terriglobus sp. TaxID=1889013 RepID=UPI003AFF736E
MNQSEALVVEDTFGDPQWSGNRFVQGQLNIRFYAGVPLVTPEGTRIGAVCVFDTRPKKVTPEQIQALQALSRQATALLELRFWTEAAQEKEQRLRIVEKSAKNTSRQLKVVQDRMTALAESSTDFIGMCDMQGAVFYGNPAALAIMGIADFDRFRQTPLPEFFFPEDRKVIDEEFLPKVLREGRAGIEIRFRHFITGAAIWMDYHVFLLKGPGEEPLGFATVSRDITAQRTADAALVESAKLAAVGRLASSIAHEINNPLEAVTNLLYLIGQDSELSQSTRDFVQIADREVARASQLTSQTLRFHRQSTAPTRIRPKFLFAEVLNLFHSRLQNRRVEVIQDYGKDTWLTCYEGDIRQVLNKMVSNAVDAMPGGGTLTIRTRKVRRWSTGDEGVRVTVADNGTGIAKEFLGKIFDAFYSTKGIGGTGLGLWISCRIVHKHRGFIRAYSSTKARHKGTAIMLWLPTELAATAGEQWQT